MFCEKCGKEIPDSTKFCPYCGAPVSKAQDFVNKAGEAFNAAEQELGSAFDEVKQSFTGNSANQQNAGGQYNGGYQNNAGYQNNGAGQYNAGYQNNGAGQYNTGYQNNGGQTPPPYRGEKLKMTEVLPHTSSCLLLHVVFMDIISSTRWLMMSM